MKKFSFRLERVLDWRGAQIQLEKAQLNRLQAGLQAMDAKLAAAARERATAQREMLAAASISGEELAAFSLFRQRSEARTAQLNQRRAAQQQAVDRQLIVLIERRREARLLERLRERRFAEWHSATEREAEQQAAENYLLRWNRSQ